VKSEVCVPQVNILSGTAVQHSVVLLFCKIRSRDIDILILEI
jgi:hypothetical protein